MPLSQYYSTLFKKSQVKNRTFHHTVEEVHLKNGASGLLINIPGASVMNIKVHFFAGMRFAKNPGLYEIAHLVEHLAFGANAKYKDEQAFEADFTKNGAYHNAWTSDFSVCYESECADFEWERILNLQRVAICQPRFNEEELTSEKGNVRAELTGYMNDYFRLIWPRIQREIGEGQPLDFTERIKTVHNIQLKDIKEHHRRTHVAKNMHFIIAGHLSRSRKRRLLDNLEHWELKSGETFTIPQDELHASEAQLIRRKDASNISFGFTWATPRRLTPLETFSMGCLNHILTGTMNSRIFGQARKRGLVYGLGSSVALNPFNSSWDFDGEVNLESAEALFDLIQTELTKTLNGQITDLELHSAKTYALGRYQIAVQTVGQIADYYANDYFNNGTFEHYDHLPDLIHSINKDTMVNLAREFIDAKIYAMAAVGSTEKAVITNLASKLKL